MSDSPAPQEFTRADWEAFVNQSGQEDIWDECTDKELALAVELARLFQQPEPTAEQVSYFIDDAAGLAPDLPDAPWTINKTFMPKARFMWLVLINDILCGLEHGEGDIPLEVLGKLPLEWEGIDHV